MIALADPAALHVARLARRIDPRGARVLEVGCGAGAVLRHLLEAGADATGLEVQTAAIERAAAAGVPRDRLVLGDGRALPFAAASFDAVVMVFSFHHVSDRPALLAEVARVLRAPGALLAPEPLPEGPMTEVVRPVEDEDDRRRDAQATLAAPPAPLRAAGRDDYVLERRFADADALVAHLLATDPARARAAAAPGVRAEVARRMRRLGRPVEDGVVLEQPVRLFDCRLDSRGP